MSDAPSMRLDKWLWVARLVRTRSRAARLCGAGLVALGADAHPKPSHPVHAGDVVTLAQGRVRRRIVVLAFAERRGPATVAHRLYDEPEPPEPLAAVAPAWTPLLDEADG
jgi:ribosome-associated heat shock protein Hsp15